MDIISCERIREMDVVDDAGTRLGAVKDLLVNLWTGQVRYIVMDASSHRWAGALGLGERRVAIPIEALRRADGQLTLPHGASALAGAPSFAASRPPAFDDAYERELATYWRCPPPGLADASPTKARANAYAAVAAHMTNEQSLGHLTTGSDANKDAGTAMTAEKRVMRGSCARCGATNRTTALYCAGCGAPLA